MAAVNETCCKSDRARVVVFVKGVAIMVVVFPEENAREYLHEDDEGDEARSTENFPDSLHSLTSERRVSGRGAPSWRRTKYSTC